MSGERRCGKTLSCYALLITYMKENFDGLIIPALHLSPWFQDTSTTQMIHTGEVLFKIILFENHSRVSFSLQSTVIYLNNLVQFSSGF